ncbi:hypothetical protein CHS0354_028619 [Potamilus streckersoni]|uniref:Uncharacterized protein n=1 Tax=Potamilus streckersoni TaxID=2493646 RepID=A0AAE0VIY9_9BIVA|nr:hypothetical protein CHS0354_028619 [Potamilus streckersoni]
MLSTVRRSCSFQGNFTSWEYTFSMMVRTSILCLISLIVAVAGTLLCVFLYSSNTTLFSPGFYVNSVSLKTSGASSPVFSGVVTRSFPDILDIDESVYVLSDSKSNCPYWAVLTTIHGPSEAVRFIATNRNWCLVIVADTKTPPRSVYLRGIEAEENVRFLSLEDQDYLYRALSLIIPREHFGRKNIGYLYAIQHGAEIIWDFDDDNLGLIDIQSKNFKPEFHYVTSCENHLSPFRCINLYPYFGINESHAWPRGFPLRRIKDQSLTPKMCNFNDKVIIGVFQSLANVQPDVDAIYRLTRDVPFNFQATPDSHRPLVVPKGMYVPFNAQAKLWNRNSFKYIPLPINVHGRVSDIWRSYMAEYFFYKNNIQVAFTPPYVKQDRNPHDNLGDLDAEIDLYRKSEQFVNFLSRHSSSISLKELYQELYQREYIEERDLRFIKVWDAMFRFVLDNQKDT